jgi:hypothetical protein
MHDLQAQTMVGNQRVAWSLLNRATRGVIADS